MARNARAKKQPPRRPRKAAPSPEPAGAFSLLAELAELAEAEAQAMETAEAEEAVPATGAVEHNPHDWSFLPSLEAVPPPRLHTPPRPCQPAELVPSPSQLQVPTPPSQLHFGWDDAVLPDLLPILPSKLQLAEELAEVLQPPQRRPAPLLVPAVPVASWRQPYAGSKGVGGGTGRAQPSAPAVQQRFAQPAYKGRMDSRAVEQTLASAPNLRPVRAARPSQRYQDGFVSDLPRSSEFGSLPSESADGAGTPNSAAGVLQELPSLPPNIDLAKLSTMMKQPEAAALLGVSVQALRAICKSTGVGRWPRNLSPAPASAGRGEKEN